MATVLDKKLTVSATKEELIDAIQKLAADNNHRILLDDEVEWLETKMKEIKRLALILRQKISGQTKATKKLSALLRPKASGKKA